MSAHKCARLKDCPKNESLAKVGGFMIIVVLAHESVGSKIVGVLFGA